MKQFRKTAKQNLALLLVFVMCFGMLGTLGTTAFAEEGEGSGTEAPPTAISPEELLALADGAGTVTLDKGYALTGTLTIESETTVTLDLNGKTLALAEDAYGSVIEVYGALILKDSIGGGTITGGNAYYGGGVYVSGGAFTMSGGTISGNTADNDGGGVYVEDGAFTMSGGTISGNTASYGGGGVCVYGDVFTMTGGTISGNTVSYGSGGGVYVGGEGSTFTMSGGTISGNEASSSGGGVYFSGGTFTMSGGTISDNQSDEDGGGVCVYGDVFTMTGGTISGNTVNGEANDAYVDSGMFRNSGGTIGMPASGPNFSSAPEVSGLIISKTVKNSDGSALTDAQKNQEFTFTLTLINTPYKTSTDTASMDTVPLSATKISAEGYTSVQLSLSPNPNNVTHTVGVPETYTCTFTLKHGETMLITVVQNTQYTVVEEVETGYTTTVTTNGSAPVSGNSATGKLGSPNADPITDTVAFTNESDSPPGVSLTITKTVVKNPDGKELTEEHTDQSFDFTLTLTDPEGKPYTGEFTVSTGTLPPDGDGEQTPGEGDEPTDDEVDETADDEVDEKADDEDDETTDDGDGEQIIDEEEVPMADGADEPTDDENAVLTPVEGEPGVYKFSLKHNEYLKIEGLPKGTKYKVTESSAENYTSKVLGDDDNSEGSLEADTTVAFENTPDVGSLKVSKTVEGKDEDKQKSFTFTVTLTPLGDEELAKEYDYTGESIEGVAPPKNGKLMLTKNKEDGTYSGTVTLKHGQSVTIKGLPAGITYTVTESGADGFDVSKTGVTGEIEKDKTKTAAFTNTKGYGGLKVTKTVVNDYGEVDTKQEFSFTVTLSDKTISGEYGEMTFTNGVAEFTLKHGESKTAADLPAKITYEVTEADPKGYVLTNRTNATGEIPKDDTVEAVFTNTKAYGALTIKKTVQNADGSALTERQKNQEFTFTVTLTPPPEGKILPEELKISDESKWTENDDGTYTVTLKHDESLTINGLPAGTTYEVTEDDAAGYTSSSTDASGTISEEDGSTAAFTNTKAYGALTVTKTVRNANGAALTDEQRNREFTFTVTLTPPVGEDLPEELKISGDGKWTENDDGTYTVTLKHGESLTISGLPAGTDYKVTEADAAGYTSSSTGASGTISEENGSTAAFANTFGDDESGPKGNLTVTKTVGGNTGDRNQVFHFAVVLSDNTINGTYGDMTFVRGVATFTLRHGESKTANDLPANITYSVMEQEANQNGYSTASKGRDGTIPEGGTARASFINTRGERQPGDPPLEEFDDPDIPLGGFPNFPDVPETGDGSHLALWLALAALSAIGLISVGFCAKRKLR